MKKYVMDESKDLEGRYKDLEAHHIEETTALLRKIKDLKARLAYGVCKIHDKAKNEYGYCELCDWEN